MCWMKETRSWTGPLILANTGSSLPRLPRLEGLPGRKLTGNQQHYTHYDKEQTSVFMRAEQNGIAEEFTINYLWQAGILLKATGRQTQNPPKSEPSCWEETHYTKLCQSKQHHLTRLPFFYRSEAHFLKQHVTDYLNLLLWHLNYLTGGQ